MGGVRILDRLVDTMIAAFGRAPLIVANAPEAVRWRADCRVVPDVQPGLGAVGGLYTAIREGPAPVVVVAWDLPFVPGSLLHRLAADLKDAKADAVLPQSDGPQGVEPLCAAYGPACQEGIERAVAEGDLRAVGFHRFIHLDILSLAQVRQFGDPAELFFNVNTADDLAAAEATWRRRG